MRRTSASTSPGSRWSTATAIPVPPAAVTSSAVSSIVSGRSYSDRRSRVLRPVQYTVAPASPSATAMPRPAPRVAPATKATLPSSDPAMSAELLDVASFWNRGTGARTASTANRTSAPPASCAGPSDSPNTTNASPTVTTGSSVERIDVAVGPTRRSPAKNRAIAPTVDTTARPLSQTRPAALTLPGSRSPPAKPASVRVIAAPVHTSVLRVRGPSRAATPSELRM